MRLSFAGDRLGFALGKSGTEDGGVPQKRFTLQPNWVDLTPNYDPTGRASELEILDDAGIDLASISVQLDWLPGSIEKANRHYSKELRYFGRPAAEVGECWTTLSVYKGSICITCFQPENVYAKLMTMCEAFAMWPGPKTYEGTSRLPLLHDGLYAALNEKTLLEFLQGTMPLYSNKCVQFGVYQNHDIPERPDAREKAMYQRSEV